MLRGGHNSLVYSDEPTQPYNSLLGQALSVGAAGSVLGAGLYGATRPMKDGGRFIDHLSSFARTAGNLSPFQMLNTFRAPEWLSPLTSEQYQLSRDPLAYSIDKSYLGNSATYSYLQKLTGMSHSQLEAAGITQKMVGLPDQVASRLEFARAGKNDIAGTLYSIVNGQRRHLASNVMMFQFTGETPSAVELSSRTIPVNRAAKSVFSAMDMWGPEGWKLHDENKLFARPDPVAGTLRPQFVPVPGLSASYQGTSYLRGFSAFGMERFNQLLSNIGHEVLGKPFTDTLSKVWGTRPDVLPGPASHTFARFGLKMGGVVGAGLALSELDWVRRQAGMPGHMTASAAMSFGIGALATRAGFGPKAGLMAGVAAFAGQMILPGFDQGILPGIASSYAMGTEWKAGMLNPFNYYRRTLEGFLPGVSSFGGSILAGAGVAALSYMRVPGSGKPLTNILMDKYQGFRGVPNKLADGTLVRAPKSIRDIFWDEMLLYGEREVDESTFTKFAKEAKGNQGYTTFPLRARMMNTLRNKVDPYTLSREMNVRWAVAEQRYKDLEEVNPVNRALVDRLREVSHRYSGKSGVISNIGFHLEGLKEQVRFSFFGARVGEEATAAAIQKLGFKAPLGRAGLLFAAGFAAHGIMSGGFLGSMESRQELQDIYSGRQLVTVGKGRWWEGAGTPWEGSDPGTLRPHWIPTMLSRGRQAGIWGWAGEEDRRSPLMKFFLSNFTHTLEEETYYDRPHPISSPAFANLPIIGPALAATIGQVFKPSRLMHSGEWIQSNDGGLQFADVYEGWRREPDYGQGARGRGIPRSPYDPQATFSELNYQYRELAGLWGFAANTLQDALTGDQMMATDRPRLAESGMMTSYRRAFWDMSMGGGGPLGEIVRRVLPSFSKDIQKQNPIINNMPTWLPDNLKWGDPMSQMPYGEVILPGPGYAALHPELKGLDPENYPLIHRYNILAQVSPRSQEFRQTRDMLYQQRAMGILTPDMEGWIDKIDMAVGKQWNMKEFETVDKNAIQLPGSSITQAAWLGSGELLRKSVAPIEYLAFPGLRPAQKFMGNRDAIEQYEYERLYGSPVGFWNKPYRDWIRPSMYSLANWLGYDGKPIWRMEADATNEYFDRAEFYKWMTLAEQAAARGDTRAKISYQYQASNTRMGVNPMGNPLSIYWSLPDSERAFFNAFAFAEGKDRDRILEMIPSDQVHLYETIWSRIDQKDPRLWSGNATSPDQEYLYRQYHQMKKGDLPPVDWVGYMEDTDIRDIKIKYLNELGKELHDYGEWEQSLQKVYSQPHLENSTQYIPSTGNIYRGAIEADIQQFFQEDGPAHLNVFTTNHSQGTVQLEYNDNRSQEIYSGIQGYLNV